MNKQEFQQKLKNMESVKDFTYTSAYDAHGKGFQEAKELALSYSESLDEPEKPVLSKEEAEWVEGLKEEQERRPFWTKYSLLYFITRCGFGYGFSYDRKDREIELKHYPHEIHAEKERLANAILYGYEVEKEKLYTVEIPNPNGDGYSKTFLGKFKDDKVELCKWSCYTSIEFADNWKQEEYAQLTESEIKEDFDWAWQFAEEVEE